MSQIRKNSLASGEYYHIFNRSIAGFKIYNNAKDFIRFLELIKYYQHANFPVSYSQLDKLTIQTRSLVYNNHINNNPKLIDIVCYCLMPTHFHLLLKQNCDDGIMRFLSLIENSYSRFFNITHKRKGPLWEGRFKAVHIESNEQLLHLSRYIHLNPTSAGLVRQPEDWEFSSYLEYIGKKDQDKICQHEDIINLDPIEYKKFTNDRKGYQRELSMIKLQLIDNYTG